MSDSEYALFARLEAKNGKEDEVEEFLRSAFPMAQDEEDTTTWFAIGSTTRRSVSTIRSPTREGDRHISTAKSPAR